MKAAVIERQGGLANLVYRDWLDPTDLAGVRWPVPLRIMNAPEHARSVNRTPFGRPVDPAVQGWNAIPSGLMAGASSVAWDRATS